MLQLLEREGPRSGLSLDSWASAKVHWAVIVPLVIRCGGRCRVRRATLAVLVDMQDSMYPCQLTAVIVTRLKIMAGEVSTTYRCDPSLDCVVDRAVLLLLSLVPASPNFISVRSRAMVEGVRKNQPLG